MSEEKTQPPSSFSEIKKRLTYCPFLKENCREDCELFVVVKSRYTNEVIGTGCVFRALLYLLDIVHGIYSREAI